MNWSIKDNKLQRSFRFNDFKEAINFVNKVAEIAESEEHHPSILIHSYKMVDICLTTAEEGNKVTEIDYKMSKRIDELLKQH